MRFFQKCEKCNMPSAVLLFSVKTSAKRNHVGNMTDAFPFEQQKNKRHTKYLPLKPNQLKKLAKRVFVDLNQIQRLQSDSISGKSDHQALKSYPRVNNNPLPQLFQLCISPTESVIKGIHGRVSFHLPHRNALLTSTPVSFLTAFLRGSAHLWGQQQP